MENAPLRLAELAELRRRSSSSPTERGARLTIRDWGPGERNLPVGPVVKLDVGSQLVVGPSSEAAPPSKGVIQTGWSTG
jgi:hypothetical protein